MEMNAKRPGFENLMPQYRVEGFDPNEVLAVVEEVDDFGQPVETLYMELCASSRWFFTVFPNGAMNHVINSITDKKATVTASIYRDINDARPAATATTTRYYEENDIHGRFYEQNAVTAAYRKALEYLGFGTPPDAVKTSSAVSRNQEDIPERGEPGVKVQGQPESQAAEMAPSEEATAAPQQEAQQVESQQPKKRGRKPKAAENAAPEVETVQQTVQPTQKVASQPAPQQNPAPTTKSSAQEEGQADKMPTIEEALQFRMPYGSLAGKTIEEAAKIKGNEFIRFHCDKARKGSDFQRAAAIFCEYRGC